MTLGKPRSVGSTIKEDDFGVFFKPPIVDLLVDSAPHEVNNSIAIVLRILRNLPCLEEKTKTVKEEALDLRIH